MSYRNHDVIRGVARFRLCAHTLEIESPGLTIPPLLLTCAMLMMYKMSSSSFFIAPIHTWSLSAGFMCLCFIPQLFYYTDDHQDRACGLARKRASALAGSWLVEVTSQQALLILISSKVILCLYLALACS